MIISDAFAFVCAISMAYLFRFEFVLTAYQIRQITNVIVWVIPLKMFVFVSFGIYRGMWRYTSIRDFWFLAYASFLSTLLIMSAIFYLNGFAGFSRAVFIIDGIFTFLFTGAIRMIIRSYYASGFNSKIINSLFHKENLKKVLIIGAGIAGEKILREILENYNLQYQVVGFIDDHPEKQDRSIHGVRVLGGIHDIAKIIALKNIQEILVTLPSANGDQIRRVVEACRHCNVSHKILPGIGEIIDGKISIRELRDINYKDLLGRPQVNLNIKGISNYLTGKTVLITGCGGSIGSELCRQVIKFEPHFVVLVDASEENLFNIQIELQNERSFRNCQAVLGHVQDKSLMNDIFNKYKPQVVFHAAAYKHVPMQEKNPWEAVFNNVIGSRVVMDMSILHHVERFVLVSTDKAVRPTNVMGASKRIAELVMQSALGNGTRFMAVRFGNVVGSSGSVIPVFRRQIEQGGPVTVTHPEVNRYFMTIPEAAQMILQAGAMGNGGEVFILRMGTPVKIADMARDLIRLSGKEPDVDIKIVFTGLRDGEKLYEELISVGEDILATAHEKILVLRTGNQTGDLNIKQQSHDILEKKIAALTKDALQHDSRAIKKILKEIVPEYTPQDNDAVL